MNEIITVLIADDHPIFRRGLRTVIESDSSLKVIAEMDNGEEALRQIQEMEPDVAVLDVNMPGMDGLAVAREIQARHLPTVPVFLTMHSDEAIFNAAVDAEVKCFVIKDGAANDIIKCIKSVVSGQSFFSSQLSPFLLNLHDKQKSFLDNLTAAERRILGHVAEGKTSREIADLLFVSLRTIDHHRANISTKLNLSGKNGLLTFALTNRARILGKS